MPAALLLPALLGVAVVAVVVVLLVWSEFWLLVRMILDLLPYLLLPSGWVGVVHLMLEVVEDTAVVAGCSLLVLLVHQACLC